MKGKITVHMDELESTEAGLTGTLPFANATCACPLLHITVIELEAA
jgi:hypothetical protein